MSFNMRMDKQTMVHPYKIKLFSDTKKIAFKKKTWMDLKGLVLSERNMTKKARYFIIPII